MFRGCTPTLRYWGVWCAATTALAAAWWLAGDTALALARPTAWQRSFEDLLVSLCAAVLLGCAGRLWWVTATTTIGLLRGRLSGEACGLTRRLVLVACGAAVVAGVSGPALAARGGDPDRLAGLPLPDRATAGSVALHAPTARPIAATDFPDSPESPALPAPATSPRGDVSRPVPAIARRTPVGVRDEVVVRSGDSLWTLAAARLPGSAGPAEVDRAWREVYAANRAEIGPDPGLIRPGQRLRLPAPEGLAPEG